jgi:hypothetical protein
VKGLRVPDMAYDWYDSMVRLNVRTYAQNTFYGTLALRQSENKLVIELAN